MKTTCPALANAPLTVAPVSRKNRDENRGRTDRANMSSPSARQAVLLLNIFIVVGTGFLDRSCTTIRPVVQFTNAAPTGIPVGYVEFYTELGPHAAQAANRLFVLADLPPVLVLDCNGKKMSSRNRVDWKSRVRIACPPGCNSFNINNGLYSSNRQGGNIRIKPEPNVTATVDVELGRVTVVRIFQDFESVETTNVRWQHFDGYSKKVRTLVIDPEIRVTVGKPQPYFERCMKCFLVTTTARRGTFAQSQFWIDGRHLDEVMAIKTDLDTAFVGVDLRKTDAVQTVAERYRQLRPVSPLPIGINVWLMLDLKPTYLSD